MPGFTLNSSTDAGISERTPLVSFEGKDSRSAFVEVAALENWNGVDADEDPMELPAADAQTGDLGVVSQHERAKTPAVSFIFRADVENAAEKAKPGVKRYLASASGVLSQVLLCVAMIGISIYETVFKGAVKSVAFDQASPNINLNILSVFICVSFASLRGQLNLLFNRSTLKMLALYFPVGCAFSLTSYLQIVIFGFIPADVFKVLEQSRLLATAMMSLAVFGRKQSLASWNALVAISFAAVIYGQISQMEATRAVNNSSASASNNYTVGLLLTVVFVIAQCGASIYSEALMKSSHRTPFYVQKFFLEASSLPFSIFTSLFLHERLRTMLEFFHFDASKLERQKEYFVDGPFAGWNSMVFSFFAFYVLKSWFSGLLCKQMSSLSKQLCSVTSVGLVYFFLKLHGVGQSICPGMMSICFSPANIATATVPMVVADASVLCSVLSYTFAQRDASRTAVLRKAVSNEDSNAACEKVKV